MNTVEQRLIFCPQCGSQESSYLKFCKLCGANLLAVRQVMTTRETDEKFDWSRTWVAEMFFSENERKRRKEELERQRGITPEIKRYHEIKAGVITSLVGLGIMIVLYVLMQGIILGGNVPPDKTEILSRLWVTGAIPLLIGIALIINGWFVSRKMIETLREASEARLHLLKTNEVRHSLRPADPNELIPLDFSVTEETTTRL